MHLVLMNVILVILDARQQHSSTVGPCLHIHFFLSLAGRQMETTGMN